MTKADIVDRIASATGLTKLETEAVIDGFMQTVVTALREGNSIELRGFGSFRVKERAPRLARNPQTNQEVRVEGRHVPVFKPSRDFQQAVDAAMKQRNSK